MGCINEQKEEETFYLCVLVSWKWKGIAREVCESGGVVDIVVSSQSHGSKIESHSGLQSFCCSLISTASLSQGWGVWGGIQAYLLYFAATALPP